MERILEVRTNTRTKKTEYLIKWCDYDDESNSWEPEANLSGAKELLKRFKAQLAAKEKTAQAERESAAAAAHLELQERVIREWKGAIDGHVRKLIKERFQMLELNGKRVSVPDTAPEELVEELHAELQKIDPSYDRTLRSMSQLKRMQKLDALLANSEHVLNRTYCFETQSCGKANCEHKCKLWKLGDGSEVPSKLKERCMKAMPMPMRKKNTEHFLSFEEADAMPDTTEQDFPSLAGKVETLAAKAMAEIQKERKEADQGKNFNVSKVRNVVQCCDCGRDRVIYSVEKPTEDEMVALDCYTEQKHWSCGAGLFDAPADGSPEAALSKKFYVRHQLTCEDPMEATYYNPASVRGRANFGPVCSICGGEESSAVPFVAESELVTNGKKPHPLCKSCHEAGKKPLLYGGVDHQKKRAEEEAGKEARRQKRQEAAEAKQMKQKPPATPQQQLPAAEVQPPARKRKPPPQGPTKKRQLLSCQGLVLKVLEAERPAGLTRSDLVSAMKKVQDTMFPYCETTAVLRRLTEEERVREADGCYYAGGSAGGGSSADSGMAGGGAAGGSAAGTAGVTETAAEPEPESDEEIIWLPPPAPFRGPILDERGSSADEDEDETNRMELMDAEEELWGESAVVQTLQRLIRMRIDASGSSLPGEMFIAIDELIRELESPLPRAAVEAVLRLIDSDPDSQSDAMGIFLPLPLTMIYDNGIIQLLN